MRSATRGLIVVSGPGRKTAVPRQIKPRILPKATLVLYSFFVRCEEFIVSFR